jgi:hypothetical protein
MSNGGSEDILSEAQEPIDLAAQSVRAKLRQVLDRRSRCATFRRESAFI